MAANITQQGGLEASNTIVPVVPCGRPDRTDKIYSPLWSLQRMYIAPEIDATIGLVDTYDDSRKSDVTSMVTAFVVVPNRSSSGPSAAILSAMAP